MPVIIVESNPISTEKKRKLVEKVTKIVSEIYELPESTVTILIKELEREDIGVSGKLLLDLVGADPERVAYQDRGKFFDNITDNDDENNK